MAIGAVGFSSRRSAPTAPRLHQPELFREHRRVLGLGAVAAGHLLEDRRHDVRLHEGEDLHDRRVVHLPHDGDGGVGREGGIGLGEDVEVLRLVGVDRDHALVDVRAQGGDFRPELLQLLLLRLDPRGALVEAVRLLAQPGLLALQFGGEVLDLDRPEVPALGADFLLLRGGGAAREGRLLDQAAGLHPVPGRPGGRASEQGHATERQGREVHQLLLHREEASRRRVARWPAISSSWPCSSRWRSCS